jgi:hypothetical protein
VGPLLPDEPSTDAPTAVEIRGHLADLDAERTLALGAGLADIDAYMADLDEEIETTRQLYVGSAVTEIATLRAELFGAQKG